MAQPRTRAAVPGHPPTGARNTRQKRAIRDALESANRPLSTEEVLAAAAHDAAGLGIATVYRVIRGLLEEGWLVAIDLPGEPSRYEVAGKAHHHHFRCTLCKRVFEVPGCVKELAIALPRGFRSVDHDVTIYGLCDRCNKGRRSSAFE